MWSIGALNNGTFFIQVCHFSLAQEMLSCERLGQAADLDLLHCP